MAIAFDRSKRPGDLNDSSLVRIRPCFADILGTTAFAENRPGVTQFISLDLNDISPTGISDISTNARKRA